MMILREMDMLLLVMCAKMTAKMTLTDRGATALNTLLKTTFFREGTPVGSFNADVNAG